MAGGRRGNNCIVRGDTQLLVPNCSIQVASCQLGRTFVGNAHVCFQVITAQVPGTEISGVELLGVAAL
jgi:hypothetical protein